jgi:UDP-N-acetylglucosamine 2-epimerase (non-hydrolysing)
MEAGNRSFDKDVPEEYNRKVIDSLSTVNLPYTQNSYDNLIREGYHKNFVFKTGNPLYEVLSHYESKINKRINHKDEYVLVTLHRSENVDNKERFSKIINAIEEISSIIKVIFPMHPRTRDMVNKHRMIIHPRVETPEPMGYFDYIHQLKHAKCVLTDSGSVPEETTIFSVPCVIIRNFIERQELIDAGSVILSGIEAEAIVRSFFQAINMQNNWIVPDDYQKPNVSDTVIRILLGK